MLQTCSKRVAALLAVLISLVLTPSAFATEGSCNPGRANQSGDWQVGFAEKFTDVYGVSADIENYYPYYSLSLTPYGTTQWVMLSASGGSFIQLGWDQSNSSWASHYFFMEAYNSTNGNDTFWSTPNTAAENAMVNFDIYQDAANKYEFHLKINGTEVRTFTFSNAMATPVWAQVYAETQNADEQMPGGTSNNDYVRNATAATGGNIHSLTGTITDSNGSWFGTNPAAGTNANGWLNVWDKYCSA